ncbi:MAG TPA: hypothetical protein VGN37_19735 [Actinocatenispora sp.]
MRAKWVFLAGLGVGYVLGSRAGRERYEQIVAAARRVKDNPTLQEAAGVVQAQAGRLATTGKDALGDRIADTKLGQTRIAERLFGTAPYEPEPANPGHHHRRNGVSHS